MINSIYSAGVSFDRPEAVKAMEKGPARAEAVSRGKERREAADSAGWVRISRNRTGTGRKQNEQGRAIRDVQKQHGRANQKETGGGKTAAEKEKYYTGVPSSEQ